MPIITETDLVIPTPISNNGPLFTVEGLPEPIEEGYIETERKLVTTVPVTDARKDLKRSEIDQLKNS